MSELNDDHDTPVSFSDEQLHEVLKAVSRCDLPLTTPYDRIKSNPKYDISFLNNIHPDIRRPVYEAARLKLIKAEPENDASFDNELMKYVSNTGSDCVNLESISIALARHYRITPQRYAKIEEILNNTHQGLEETNRFVTIMQAILDQYRNKKKDQPTAPGLLKFAQTCIDMENLVPGVAVKDVLRNYVDSMRTYTPSYVEELLENLIKQQYGNSQTQIVENNVTRSVKQSPTLTAADTLSLGYSDSDG